MVGAVVSATVTLNVFVATLPAPSTAVQVTVVSPSGKRAPEAGAQVTVTGPTASVAAGSGKLTTAPPGPAASAVTSGAAPMAGGVGSATFTVKLALAALPCASTAVQVTVVVPIGNGEPEGGLHVTVRGPSTESMAPTVKLTAAPSGPVASAVIGSGTVITGGVVSTTVTVKVAVAILPALSLLVQVTVVAPSGNVEPDAGAHITATAPSTVSTAPAL